VFNSFNFCTPFGCNTLIKKVSNIVSEVNWPAKASYERLIDWKTTFVVPLVWTDIIYLQCRSQLGATRIKLHHVSVDVLICAVSSRQVSLFLLLSRCFTICEEPCLTNWHVSANVSIQNFVGSFLQYFWTS